MYVYRYEGSEERTWGAPALKGSRRLTAVVRELGDQGEAGVMGVWEGQVFEKDNVREGGTRTRALEEHLYDGRN